MDIKPTDDDMIDLVYAGSRMPLDEVRAHRGTVHPDRAMVVQPADPDATARFRVAPADLMSELADVRRERTGAEVLAGFDAARYPYRLVSRRLKHALNSLGPELPGLARKGGTTNRAYVNPVDAQELGVVDGDLIEITSPRASLIGVVETAPDVRRGVVSMAHSWGGSSLGDEKVRDIGAPTNRLVSTTDGYDVVTGMVIQSAIPVALRPVDDPHVRHVDDPATEQRH
jgi:anaerobic selenocysteine-containing dehydrogenase